MPFTVPKDFGQNKPVCITVGKTVPSPSAISEYDMHTKIDTDIPEKAPLFFFFVAL